MTKNTKHSNRNNLIYYYFKLSTLKNKNKSLTAMLIRSKRILNLIMQFYAFFSKFLYSIIYFSDETIAG